MTGARVEQAPSPPSTSRLSVGLAVSWACMSSSAVVIVLAAPIPPLTIAATRVAITAALWALIGLVLARRTAAPSKVRVPHGRIAASGVLLGVHFAMWIGSLSFTSVPHAAVLVATQPLFAGLFGLALGDRATWRLVLGVVIALVGTALMTHGESAGASLFGDALALGAGACSAAYLVINRGVRDALPLPNLLARVNAWAAVTILIGMLLLGPAVVHPGTVPADWLAVVWLGMVPGFLGHGLMNWAARALPVHVVSVAILLEPVGAALAAWLLLSQVIGGQEAFGAGMLLAGAAVALGASEEAPRHASGESPGESE